uniref:WGS project CBMI000000000 data, contig CS3069_c002840 n=1 Tax=Fusarium clavum TaxID=2594811 RepID=A0A090MD94_9HYPO|nr:unnamed protein product [Fusarium clavum]
MPVTVSVIDHPARPWGQDKASSVEEILKATNTKEFTRCKQVIQSVFSIGGSIEDKFVSGSKNGLVWAAFNAYSNHHHLTIRPEDVWFAIITQLSSHINANAEKLRHLFVSHKGKKELVIEQAGFLHTANYGAFVQSITREMVDVKDPTLRDWVLPSFSTTTDVDRAVGSVLLMGAMQQYFSYTCSLTCGLPSVTLLGEVTDYEDILSRLDKLEKLGEEPTRFAELLRPVVRRMILSFEEPTSPEVKKFWNSIADMHEMSGATTLTGWITAFCFWNDEGKAQNGGWGCELDGLSYPSVETQDIPGDFVTVPVKVNDNGTVYSCRMLAGLIGIQALPDYDYDPVAAKAYYEARDEYFDDERHQLFEDDKEDGALEEKQEGFSTGKKNLGFPGIQPVSGWMIYEDKDGMPDGTGHWDGKRGTF